jgi:hypothetical protein
LKFLLYLWEGNSCVFCYNIFTWFFSFLLTARIYFCCQSTVFISLVLLPYQVPFTVGLVSHFFLCGAAGLRGTFPGYPRPPSLLSFFWTTQHEYHNTQHPWEAHPAWDLNPADLAVVSGECRSSLHHPTVSPY